MEPFPQQDPSEAPDTGLFSTLEQIKDQAQSIGVGLGASTQQLSRSLVELPLTAQQLAAEMPKVFGRMYRAGLRPGDPTRSPAEILELFAQIPGSAKLNLEEMDVLKFLSERHASHIISRKNGGSAKPENLIWEWGPWNLARGDRNMTLHELLVVRVHNALTSIVENSGTIARLGLTSLGLAVLTQTCVTAIAYLLDLHRGDITVEEFRDKILVAAKEAGIATAILFPVLIMIIALLPEVTVVLATPAVVLGLNAAFGVSLTIPLLQSLVRHIESEGFGSEVASAYRDLLGGLQS